MNKKIIIVSGDPFSINSEIIYKTWNKLNIKLKKNIFLIGNYKLISKQLIKLKKKDILLKVKNIASSMNSPKLKIIDISLKYKYPFKIRIKDSEKYIIKSLNMAHELASSKNVKGLINCPIDKKLISSTKKIGLTEFFASKCQVKKDSEVMLIYNKKLSVLPLTTHIDLKDVTKSINKRLIINKITTLNKFYKKILKKKPKIAVLGLNPHNGEFKKNSKEIKEIYPAITHLRKKGLSIEGPISADTIFIDKFKKFDVVVGTYHDQVLTPFKTLFKFDAINLTLGLKYIRVSPDHGPAVDLIGKNKANCLSLLKCVNFIDKLS